MKDKVVHFLSRFSTKELTHFKDFISSPVFNKRDKVVSLFEYIQKTSLKGEITDLNEEAAFKKVYPGEKFVVNKIRKLKAVLLDLVLEFYRFRSWQAAKEEKSVHLLREFNRVGESTYFLQYYQKIKDGLEKGGRSILFYDQAFLMERELLLFRQRSADRSNEKNFNEAFRALLVATFTKLLKYGYAAMGRKRVIGDTYLPDDIGQLIENLDTELMQEEPMARIYYALFSSLKHLENESLLPELIELIREHVDALQTEEAFEVFSGANNNLVWQSRLLGKTKDAELLELNRLSYEVLIKQRGMPLTIWQYKNMIILACRLGQFEFSEAFLTEALTYLRGTDEEKEAAEMFNRGVWFFYQSRYPEAESQFNKVMPLLTDVFFELDARAYLLIIFYETGNAVGMESLVHSFRMYLERSERVSENHKENYGEFIRLFRRLMGTPPRDRKKVEKLIGEVNDLDFGMGRNWLLEKLESM